MKKSILSLVVIMIITLISVNTVKAQETKWEVSASYIYGEFSDEFSKEIYENFNGFGIAVSRTIYTDWIGAGVYYKNISSDGIPIVYGYEDQTAKSDIKISSWGPEIFVTPFKFVKIYARYGFLTVKENLYSAIGDDSAELDGKSLDYGARFNFRLVKNLNLLLGAEKSVLKLDDMELSGLLDSWSITAGVGYKF